MDTSAHASSGPATAAAAGALGGAWVRWGERRPVVFLEGSPLRLRLALPLPSAASGWCGVLRRVYWRVGGRRTHDWVALRLQPLPGGPARSRASGGG